MRLRPQGYAIGPTVVICAGCVTGTPSSNLPSGSTQSPVPLTQMVTPSHPDESPWIFPGSATSPGEGPCANTTLGAVLDEIRQGFPDVADITRLKTPGPTGITVVAGLPPATGVAAYIVGLSDERSVGAIFFRGAGCAGEACQDRTYWYFETGAGCRARWVGHNRAIDRPDGAHGPCVDFEGSSVWLTPGDPDPRRRCDADWSPQDISGTRRAVSLDALGGCGRQDRLQVIPIQLSIAQGADRALAELSLDGTGIPFLDGRSFMGRVERQSFTSSTDETIAGVCPVHRRIDISLDFEEPTFTGVPGGFGIVDIVGEVPAGCSPVPDACRSSMHLVKEGVFPSP